MILSSRLPEFMFTAARLVIVSLTLLLFVTPSSAEEATDAKWVEVKGCKFRIPPESRETTFTWNGDCVDGYVHGRGTLDLDGVIYDGEFERGSLVSGEVRFGSGSYKGELKDNVPAGQGVMRLPDGTVIEGKFKSSAVIGTADVTWVNGARYRGEVIDLVTMHGAGKITYADGTTYEGGFQHGLYHGKGKSVWANGAKYDGDYAFGKEQGQGIFTNPLGSTFVGEWMSGHRHGKGSSREADGTLCVADFVSDQMQGKGRCDYPDGSWQEGEYKNGKLNGECKLYYATKASYSGQCLGGEPSGRGHYEIPADGSVYDGEMAAGKFHGRGRLTRPGYSYDGEFVGGLLNGRGKEILESGEQYEGDFARGVREGMGKLRLGADGSEVTYEGAFKNGYMHGQGELRDAAARFTGEFKRGMFVKGRMRTEDGRTIEADLEANTFFEVKADGSKVPVDSELVPDPEA
jgi:hypothetical protein